MIFYQDFKNIVIDGSSVYERSVVTQLDRAWSTWTGWAVLLGIIEAGKTVRIVPLSVAKQKKLGENKAYTSAKSGTVNRPRRPRPCTSGIDASNSPRDERFPRTDKLNLPCTGQDDIVEVHYSPDGFEPSISNCSKSATWVRRPPMFARNSGPDDALVHELVHALRVLRGKYLQLPTRSKAYKNEEEFFAILVQNVYASEKGMPIYWGNQPGHAGLLSRLSTSPDRLSISERFLGKGQRPLSLEELENRLLLYKLVRQNQDLCGNILAHVTAAFNPISEFMLNANQYAPDPMLAYPQPRYASPWSDPARLPTVEGMIVWPDYRNKTKGETDNPNELKFVAPGSDHLEQLRQRFGQLGYG